MPMMDIGRFDNNEKCEVFEMSRFSEKGYVVKENAPIYMTADMDRTAKWFEDVMGWYSKQF